MKKISLLLVFITLFSACNKEEVIAPTETLSTTKTISSKNANSTASRSMFDNRQQEQNLKAKINIYAYVIGKMFDENFTETKALITAAIEQNPEGQSVVKLAQLITNNQTFRSNIVHQLYIFYGIPDITMRGSIYPPVGDNIEQLTPAITPIILEEISSGNFSDALELYIARDFNSQNPYNFINMGYHPLSLPTDSFSIYQFTNSTQEEDATILFTPSFIANHTENVLIVRPYRDATHPYNYIPVNDFTTFYN